MNVTAQYPAAMNSPTRTRASHDFDDSPYRGKQARFGNHDDFYNFLDSNRGPPGPVKSGVPTQVQIPPPSQRGIPPGPHSPQGPVGDQSRPPVTNPSQGPQRSASGRSRPPSYSGSRSEELLVGRNGDNGTPQKHSNDDSALKVQRQNGRRGGGNGGGGGRPITSGGPSSKNNTPPRTGGNSPQRNADGGARPTSSDSLDPGSAGAAIQRLKSPSVMSCVLQPLDQKVKEYSAHMNQEQDEMARLDEEIRALQARRAKADMRYMDAKSKHDDYLRQYQDVERAMRGEAPIPRELPPMPVPQDHHQQQQRPVSIRDEDEDYDDEDYEQHPPVQQRQVQSQQSFGRTSQKGSFGARFRNSIFGGR